MITTTHLKSGHSRPIFLYIVFSMQLIISVDKILRLVKFEPLITDAGNYRSANCATAIALITAILECC